MPLIYHVIIMQEWEQAQAAGEYRISTRGRTLAKGQYSFDSGGTT
jgi:hypothetical protein